MIEKNIFTPNFEVHPVNATLNNVVQML